MEPFQRVTGVAVPYPVDDVNTDEITPVYRSLEPDFAALFFSRRRRRPDGSLDPDFPFNQPRYAAAAVLVAGRNFGCGSSRESAVWAMRAVGIAVIVARSFSDLYRDNCLKNGLLPVVLEPHEQAPFEEEVVTAPRGATVTVDLVDQTIRAPSGRRFAFEIDGAERTALLEGLDDIGISLRALDAIAAYEQRISEAAPWLQEIAGRARPRTGGARPGEASSKEMAS